MTPAQQRVSRPPREEMVAVDGVRFRTLAWDPPRHRRTTPTFALAGAGRTAEDFGHLAASLRSDRKVFGVDLPGFGRSERRGPYDPVQVADRVAGLVLHVMEGETGDGRVDLVGHGLGGNVAIALAGSRPDLVRRLVVIDAPYRTRHVPWPLRRTGVVLRLPSMTQLRDAGVPIAWLRGHLATRAGLPDVAVERALLVWGVQDPWLSPAVSTAVLRDLARATPDVRHVTIPRTGHAPHLTAPAAVTSAIVDFLRAPFPE